MELKELKKTWDKLAPDKELDEEQIMGLLRKRTGNLIDRIDRNVRIGFVILFALILLFILDDLVFGPMLLEQVETDVKMPGWILFLSIFSNTLVVITFIYFVSQYYRVKKSCDLACNLRETLLKIIETLRIYQRLFYLALIILTISMGLQFISGLYSGMHEGIERNGVLLAEVPLGKWILVFVIGLAVLLFIVGGIYLLMRWGFRRLYGNYICKLKKNLKELDEIDN